MNVRMPVWLQSCPKTVFAIGLLIIAFGLLDTGRGLSLIFSRDSLGKGESIDVLVIGIAALVGGTCTIRGRNWARWLVAVWITLHVALSALDPWTLAVHAAILIVAVVGMFNPAASGYFRSRSAH